MIAVFVLLSSVIIVSRSSGNKSVSTPSEAAPLTEMRGVWIPYMTLDTEGASDVKAAFIEKADTILSEVSDGGFNTVVVQVRPFCDALYRSRIFPWSHILTGVQGQDPGFDPLEYLCKACRNANIQIHAWVNPYRVSTANTPDTLSPDNPYLQDKEIGFELNGAIYLNPASDRARELVTEGVRELIENYDIDGIQFDDYFYPENCGDFDASDYDTYCQSVSSPLSLSEWRCENVNTLIKNVYDAVHSVDGMVFGISPQGNLGNNQGLYADVVKWCECDGYIDYICPQLYFSIDNPALGFEDGLDEWLKVSQHDGLQFYVGIAGYKAGTDADEGTWADNSDILTTEIEIVRKHQLDGFLLYSYDSFHNDDNEIEVQNVMRYLTSSPTQ